MLDWVTARIPLISLTEEARCAALSLGDRIVKYCPKTGETRYESFCWESVRSDSHQIVVKAGTDLWMQGSPARVIGDGDAVFGAGASSAMDILGCVDRMRAFVSLKLGVVLPPANQWLVSRVDVTANIELESLSEVQVALSVLRNCEGGRYRVSQQAGDTVYWNHSSKLRKAKAYAKGPHLTKLMKKVGFEGRRYNLLEIEKANRLLRLELTLGREWFARNPWLNVTPTDLVNEWESYFSRMIGGAEMSDENKIFDLVMAASPSEGQGKSAYSLWLMIQTEGWQRASNLTPRRTWYRNLKILKSAGLSDSDISAGKVVPLRRRILDARIVTHWSELAAA